MKNKPKIFAIVVTFNRENLLLKSLGGILNQTVPVDEIIIIDNASTDGTKQVILDQFRDNEKIQYIYLNHNTGSAGGFHTGVKMAYEQGADWIWFLDDDVSPTNDCLEVMLGYKDISGCIHPNKFDVNGKEFIWEAVFDSTTGHVAFLPNLSFKNGKDFTFVNIGCFEGMLIHREIVTRIGFPDERFFIAGDDSIYGFLASLYTNVIFVKKAVIRKLIPFNYTVSPTFLYYATRNQFLVREYLKKYNIFNRRLFFLYFISFILFASIKQTIRNKSLATPVYVLRGMIDGVRRKFYRIN